MARISQAVGVTQRSLRDGPGGAVVVVVALIAVGGGVVLLGLADLADYLLARAGKRSLLHRRPVEDPRPQTFDVFNPTAAEARRTPFRDTGFR